MSGPEVMMGEGEGRGEERGVSQGYTYTPLPANPSLPPSLILEEGAGETRDIKGVRKEFEEILMAIGRSERG